MSRSIFSSSATSQAPSPTHLTPSKTTTPLTHIDSTGIQELRLKKGQMFPRIRIDGPYGSPAEDIFRNEVSVMVGAGIGVTSWASILKSIWHMHNNAEASAKSRLQRLEFIWVCKDILHYKWLHEQITLLEAQSMALGSEQRWPIRRTRIFITKQLDPARLERVPIRVVDRCVWSSKNSINEERVSADWDAASVSDTSLATITAAQFQGEMNQGRPDFARELRALTHELVDDASEGDHKTVKAGVYYCGPDAAGKALRDACLRVWDKDVEYKFWKERG